MPDKCSFCTSGRKNSTYNGSFHSIPNEKKNPELKLSWINAFPPKDGFEPKQSTRLCNLHLCDDDFIEERCDTNVSRKESRGDLRSKKLRNDAAPHIWPGYPDYHTKIWREGLVTNGNSMVEIAMPVLGNLMKQKKLFG